MWSKTSRGNNAFSSDFDNVIDLSAFRSRKSDKRFVLYYLNSAGYFRTHVMELTQGNVIEIQALETLASVLNLYQPDCILVEQSLTWGNPYSLVQHLTEQHNAPVIMLFEPTELATANENIRRAYACGVSDTLFAPLCHQELLTSLKILLQITQHPFASRFHF